MIIYAPVDASSKTIKTKLIITASTKNQLYITQINTGETINVIFTEGFNINIPIYLNREKSLDQLVLSHAFTPASFLFSWNFKK